MRALTAAEIVRIWEVGYRQHPLDRALTILAAGLPDQRREDLAALSIGQRDKHLLALRERIFGQHIAGQAQCPVCKRQVEFVLETTDLYVLAEPEAAGPTQFETADGLELEFRLPNSVDLAAIVGCVDVEEARRILAHRCVARARRDGADVPVEALPEGTLNALAEQMAEHDRQAEIDLELNCPACGHVWPLAFDIAVYFWVEIRAQTQRLLREVHTLARAYGWREDDILSMSAVRRQFYLEQVG
jgi:hypothetical protein